MRLDTYKYPCAYARVDTGGLLARDNTCSFKGVGASDHRCHFTRQPRKGMTASKVLHNNMICYSAACWLEAQQTPLLL